MSVGSVPELPTGLASVATLRRRADLIARVRDFFRGRDVLEVETPRLCASGVVDVHLEPLRVPGSAPGGEDMFLMTSPEHSHKRLLAAGSGAIFEICRAFRGGERGPRHNPEFTLLEWYRPAWNHLQLMDEVEALILHVLAGTAAVAALRDGPFARVTYREAFERSLGLDPFMASDADLAAAAVAAAVDVPDGMAGADRDAWLDLLLVTCVEPTLGNGSPTFLLDYPASQAALARLRPTDPPVAERFELYIDGVELANGYHELTDPGEQRSRFEAANEGRRRQGKAVLPIDERFLEALEVGLPACAGVAIGLDRVVMLATGASTIDEVIAFPFEQA